MVKFCLLQVKLCFEGFIMIQNSEDYFLSKRMEHEYSQFSLKGFRWCHMVIVITEILVIVNCQRLKAYDISVAEFTFIFRWYEGEKCLFQGLRLALYNRLNTEDSPLPPFHMKIEAGLASKILWMFSLRWLTMSTISITNMINILDFKCNVITFLCYRQYLSDWSTSYVIRCQRV